MSMKFVIFVNSKIQTNLKSRCGVLDKSLTLLTRGPGFDPGFTSLSNETKLWPWLNMTLSVDGALNTHTNK